MPNGRRCIVVGAGLLGLSAARALARRRWEVTVLEAAATVGHPRAGSTGDARIFRLGYPDPFYVDLAGRALGAWHALEADTGRRLLRARDQLSWGETATLDAVASALEAAGAPVERLAASAAARRYPGILPAGPVLREPGSGVLAADECLRALCDHARFDLLTGVRVTALRPDTDRVTVVTADGRHREADAVVACAGPGTLSLVDVPSERAAAPTRPQVAYFAARGHRAPATLPVFIEWGPDMLYGLPVLGTGPHAGTYKVSHHLPGAAFAPGERFDPAGSGPPGPDDPARVAALGAAVERLLPALDPSPVATERCVYDNTVDADFLLDRIGNVVVGCGTSGHAFKFGPLLGELLAERAEGLDPSVDLTRFALGRPGTPHPA